MSKRKPSPARTGIEERTDAKGVQRFRGTAYDKASGRRLKGPWSATLAEARAWRVDALARLQAGTLSGHLGPTIEVAAEEFIDGIAAGTIVNRSSRPYKPSTRRGYAHDLRQRIVPEFGAVRMSRLTRPDVQRWADGLAGDGLSAQRVRNIVTALRALYGWGIGRGMAHVNPCAGLRLPTGGEPRDRVVTPTEAERLIAALEPRDQAALGLAVYAGLRLGELLALDWADVDLQARTIRVRRSWDHGERQFIEVKSRAGDRTVPIIGRLGSLLADHRVLTDHRPGLLYPSPQDAERPVTQAGLTSRMKRSWKKAKLDGLTLHEARHTAASLFIASGMNAKAVSTFMGHANISVTLDRYGHLFPGAEDEARVLIDAYLDRLDRP